MESKEVYEVCPGADLLALLSQRHVLMLFYCLGDGPQSFSVLEERLAINTATLSDRLQSLEDAKLIIKEPCPKDSRCHYYVLTDKGKIVSTLIKKISEASR